MTKGFGLVSVLVTVVVIVIVAGGIYYGTQSMRTTPTNSNDAPDGTEDVQDATSTTPLLDGTYTLDVAESSITWTGRRLILETSHTGTLSLTSGEVAVTDGAVVSGDFVIDMMSLKDDGSGVEKHLKSDDFFAVEKYPTARFVVTEASGGMVSGELTIKDETHPITFPVAPIQDGNTLEATATFDIDRTLWGVRFGSGSFFKDIGDQAIDDMVTIALHLHATKSE